MRSRMTKGASAARVSKFVPIQVRVELADQLRAWAELQGKSMSAIANQAIAKELRRLEAQAERDKLYRARAPADSGEPEHYERATKGLVASARGVKVG